MKPGRKLRMATDRGALPTHRATRLMPRMVTDAEESLTRTGSGKQTTAMLHSMRASARGQLATAPRQ